MPTRPAVAASFAAAAVLAAALSSCSTAATSGAAGSPSPSSSAPAALASAVPAVPSTDAPPPCTTKACIATTAELALPGVVANDESVITKAVCYQSTVRHHAAAGTWTVKCRATYSDGKVLTGYANLLPDQDKLTWEPTGT